MAGRWREAVVALVFLVSVAALTASSTLALFSSEDDLATRDRLHAASTDLSTAAREPVEGLPPDRPGALLPEPDNRRLAAVARRVLVNHPGTEGGFYLAHSDQFAGVELIHSVPSGSVAESEAGSVENDPKVAGKKAKDKKAGKKAEKAEPEKWEATGRKNGPSGRRDPPPLETPSIRQQCREALALAPGDPPLVDIRDVGPSRVAVATAPVGDDRPARVAVWIMVRLTGPEQQKARLARLQLATGISLGGVLMALGLSVGLMRSLRQEEQRRAEIGDELRKAEHLASLGRLLAGIAHEVRNPLTAIRSTVQLWERLPDQARTPESLAAVVGAVDRLNELVGRLLLFVRAGHESRRPVDLNAIAAETLELVRAQADDQHVTLESDLMPGLPLVPGFDQAVRQVVLNLVTNALQVMPGGGRVTCRTRTLPKNRVELTVADSGPGVPADAQDRIFEPFFTTRPDGTGLGLALCRDVARQHRGDVIFDPTGPGATFRLILPAVAGDLS